MKITRVIALAALVAASGVTVTSAQNLRDADQPAEFPASYYKCTQYVDSRGCVYVRAGISGNVSWIPRVSRARKQICGQTPSNPGAVASAAPKAKAPVQITLDAPKATAPVAVKPKVRKPIAVAAAPKRKVNRVNVRRPAPVRKPVIAAAAPQVIAVQPAPRALAKRKVVSIAQTGARVANACNGGTATRKGVRCGPQTQLHYTPRTNVATAAPRAIAQPTGRIVTTHRAQVATASRSYRTQVNTISGATRVAPKHVVVNRQNTQQLPIPHGYRPVWDDDRLNPQRAEQSLAGNAQMKLIWTQTVPRRLINTADGRDVTASTPLVYPYLDVATQTRNLGTVSIVRRDNGQLVKRILRNRASAKVRAPVISSRSAPAVQPKPVAATSQYVQVGTYNQQGSAQTVAKRIQRMDLPVRIGKYTRGGATYRMVIAGPFGSNINGVLSKLRASGYHNASLR